MRPSDEKEVKLLKRKVPHQMGWDGMGWDGIGWDWMGLDGIGWDRMGWGGIDCGYW